MSDVVPTVGRLPLRSFDDEFLPRADALLAANAVHEELPHGGELTGRPR